MKDSLCGLIALALLTLGCSSHRGPSTTLSVSAPNTVDSETVTMEVTLRLPHFAEDMQLEESDLENMAFSISARRPDGSLVRRSLRSDKFRKASTTLPRAAVTLGPDGKTTDVIVRLEEPGYQQRFQLARARRVEGTLHLTAGLVVAKGVTARGVALSRLSGAPVPIDSLELFGPDVPLRDTFGLKSKDWVQWAGAGRFELHFNKSGTFDLLARSFGHGSGALSQVPLDAATPSQELRIEVGGPARLMGLLVGSDGKPPLPTELRAVSAELLEGRWSAFSKRASTKSAREGSGLMDATTLSRPDGSFEFLGLRRGEYTLLATVPGPSDEEYLTIGEGVAGLAPKRIEATLDLPHIVVSLRDAGGNPWRPRTNTEVELPWETLSHGTTWPTEPRVIVRDAGPIGAPSLVSAPQMTRDCSPDKALGMPHRRIYRVFQGRQYQVIVVGGPFAGSVQLLAVPEGTGAVVARFDAGAAVGLGTLELSVPGAERRSLAWGFQAEILNDEDPTGVLLAGLSEGNRLYRFHLPAGDYRVRLRGVPCGTSHGTRPAPDSSYLTERVRIVEGQSSRESFTLRNGGTLRVSIDCETPSVEPPVAEGLQHLRGFLGSMWKDVEAVESPRCVATLALLHPSGEVEIVYRMMEASGITNFSSLTDSFPSESTWTTTSLSTGNFTLYVRLQDGRERRIPVTIQEGAATAVNVAFD